MKEAGRGVQMQHLENAGTARSVSTQTGSMTGQTPRLSKVNLFTLFSLWMELFPATEAQRQKYQKKEEGKHGPLGDNEDMARVPVDKKQVKRTGLVVVKNMKIVGLHCSSEDLHAGQIALIKHGSRLKSCDLYFSRKPCSACLKMIVNGLLGATKMLRIALTTDSEMDCENSKRREMKCSQRKHSYRSFEAFKVVLPFKL